MPVPTENQQRSSFLSSQISLVNTRVVQTAPDQARYLINLKTLPLAIKVFQASQSAQGIN